MKEALKKAMMISISEVLETMFYLTVEISEENELHDFYSNSGKDVHTCKLTYSGPFKGYFNILIPVLLLREITENFLGIPGEELKAEHTEGTLKEIMNMIAGSVFSNYDESLIFSLGIPEIISNDDTETVTEDTDKSLLFHVKTMEGSMALGILFSA